MLKPYPSYKPTNIPWLPKMPEHWEMRKAKWTFRKENRPVREEDDIVTAFRDGTVTLRKNRREEGFTNSLQEIGYQGIRKNDLVIHGMDAFAGAIGVSNSDGKGSPVYNVCTPKIKADVFFFSHLIREMARSGFITSLAKGIRERSTEFRYNIFGEQPLPIPPFEEQTTISNFLDARISQINTFIANKEKIIELLKERKAAFINEQLSNPPIPPLAKGGKGGFWEWKKLKYVAKVVLGKMLCNDDKGNYQLRPYLKSKNIGWEQVIIDEIENMWFSQNELKIYRVQKKDLLVSEGGDVGKTCIWDDELEECYIQNSVHKITFSDECNPLFYLNYFIVQGHKGFFKSIVNQVSIGHLTREKLIEIKVPVPPLRIQNSIVEKIKSESSKLDRAIADCQKEIDLIQEYKTVLIAEAVTGKIKVI